MLKISNLTKVFSPNSPTQHIALNKLELEVEKEEFVCVIGSNGAGKSTLFNAISGFFWSDGGSIILEGKNITYEREHKRSAYIGRLFQDPMMGTAPSLTIEENLALAYSRSKRKGLKLAIHSNEREFFKSALAEFEMGLEDRIHTKVGLLSGGQRQALTLLMGTLVPPKLLLLDEHTAALDPATAEKVMRITKEIIAKHKLTAMMITHNIQDALTSGTRTIMMNKGKIILDLKGKEREEMTVSKLMDFYSATQKEALSDRMLLS